MSLPEMIELGSRKFTRYLSHEVIGGPAIWRAFWFSTDFHLRLLKKDDKWHCSLQSFIDEKLDCDWFDTPYEAYKSFLRAERNRIILHHERDLSFIDRELGSPDIRCLRLENV